MGAGSETGRRSLALAAYADDLDNPIADGFLYGLAAPFSIVDGDSSAAHAAEADLANLPVGGALGDLLEPSARCSSWRSDSPSSAGSNPRF